MNAGFALICSSYPTSDLVLLTHQEGAVGDFAMNEMQVKRRSGLAGSGPGGWPRLGGASAQGLHHRRHRKRVPPAVPHSSRGPPFRPLWFCRTFLCCRPRRSEAAEAKRCATAPPAQAAAKPLPKTGADCRMQRRVPSWLKTTVLLPRHTWFIAYVCLPASSGRLGTPAVPAGIAYVTHRSRWHET